MSDGWETSGAPSDSEPPPRAARTFLLEGRVQGVGFRPFVHALATRLGIAGRVRNLAGRVAIEAEAGEDALDRFARALIEEAPPLSRPRIARVRDAEPTGAESFVIAASETGGEADVHLPPDLFVCADCLAEMRDAGDRRHRYPFITCTQCGPRYTIIERLPYDRANTSMADFALCPQCRAEYEDPRSRRFHAEPLGCAACGPALTFRDVAGATIHGDEAALAAALRILGAGGIVATKGVGGYHLMCDAANDSAIARLRERKRRPSKPLAVMFPERGSDGLEALGACVEVDAAARAAVADPSRPIVLLARRRTCPLSPLLAPGLGELGVFLPYSPLHALLLDGFGAPLVATSGNISGEPVLTDEAAAESRLAPVADAFLHHDRPILRPADDSVARIIAGAARSIRLGRGTAPLEMALPLTLDAPVLALGGQMKAAIALGIGARAVLAPHIGELESPRARDVLARLTTDLPRLYGVTPSRLVVDAHPGYASTRWARAQGLPVTTVLHHVAHASALAGEYPEVARWLVFAWDGVGLGDDGTLWGGEALLGAPGAWRRVASLRPFRPPGGDKAAREPWRSAAALMWEGARAYVPPIDAAAAALAEGAWRRKLNSPATSAVGRLFDAAASLLLGEAAASYEGEGPMRLEALATRAGDCGAVADALALGRDAAGLLRADWSAALDMLTDASSPAAERALRFHLMLAETLVAMTNAIARAEGGRDHRAAFDAVGLTGGVFQNRLLAEAAIVRLRRHGVRVELPRQVPANDGGLAFGQLVEAAAVLGRRYDSDGEITL